MIREASIRIKHVSKAQTYFPKSSQLIIWKQKSSLGAIEVFEDVYHLYIFFWVL